MQSADKAVAIIGLGYVGLPLAVQAAEKKYHVVGIDLNEQLLELVNKRVSPFANDARFAKALAGVSKTQLEATSDFSKLESVQTIVICVPTPTDDNVPDLGYVKSAAKAVAKHLKRGQLVVLESTVNPGVTRDVVMPLLEKASGLVCGKDFYLAHCPERIDPGNSTFFVGNLNRVVGGITPACTKRAHAFYASVIDSAIIDLASPEEAEFVKSWENSHRNVMIALANEAAVICDALDMDINNVLKGLQSKVDQFGLRLASPGIGPGGHCIPEDIHYVIKKARQQGIDTHFLDAAAQLNDKMPLYAVGQLRTMVKSNGEDLRKLNVAVLGLAYKENIEDARRSPAIDVAHLLVQRAKHVSLHDPHVDLDRIIARGTEKIADLGKALEGAEAVFIATAHDAYKKLTPEIFKKHGIRYVYDGRNCLDNAAFAGSGVAYKGMGR